MDPIQRVELTFCERIIPSQESRTLLDLTDLCLKWVAGPSPLYNDRVRCPGPRLEVGLNPAFVQFPSGAVSPRWVIQVILRCPSRPANIYAAVWP